MSSLYQSVKACIYKTPVSEQVEVVTKDVNTPEADDTDPDGMKENEAPDYTSNKKTDEQSEATQQAGYVWRMSSGLYHVTTGAVGYGVGSVKWAAGKGYDVGSAVVSHVKVPAIPRLTVKKKDKKE